MADTMLPSREGQPSPRAETGQWDPVDWMSGALFVVFGSVKAGEPGFGRGREAWRRDATEALDFLGRNGIVLARIEDRQRTTLRAWRLSDLVCRVFGHRPPKRWYTNAAGDGGGWLCTRCLTELPPPVAPTSVGDDR